MLVFPHPARDRRRRDLRELARGGEIVWADFIGTDETDTPRIHVDPNYEPQKHRREEGAEDRRLHRYRPHG